MMFRICSSAVKTDQWVPPKKSHVGVFDVNCISSSFFCEQLFCTTRRESSIELALDPYSQSKGCECPIMHTPRNQEILYFKLPPKNQVLDEDCATDESFHDTENIYRWTFFKPF
ncbi:unnamed protein product [Larinioides sclopetarius]|uniref:Uncharacterized protein n=1 Tax=Larinioides sclopetarius TaxID=280406 RepID=A0AAV2AIC6_9ARAC